MVYVIAAAVVVADHADLRNALLNRLDRKRPFHWLTDHGPVVRRHVIELLIERHVRAHVAVHPPVRAKEQEPARGRLLTELILPHLAADSVDHITFEQRGGQDQHDKRTMKVFTKETPVAPKWTYEWAGKDEHRCRSPTSSLEQPWSTRSAATPAGGRNSWPAASSPASSPRKR